MYTLGLVPSRLEHTDGQYPSLDLRSTDVVWRAELATQERALNTRDQLLVGAATVFQRVGYREATISAITAAVSLTPGALYFHFGSKEHIARALIEEQHRLVRDAAEVTLQRTHEPALVKMMLMCADLARRLVDDPVVRAGVRLTTDQAFDEPVVKPYLDWLATFTDLAERAETDGETTGVVPPDLLAHFIVPAFAGVQIMSDALTKRADVVSRVHEMWQVLIPAVVPAERHEQMLEAAKRIFTQSGGS